MARKKKAEGKEESGGSFEKELARLEEIVGRLEGELPGLDESIKLYEQGVKSLKACQKKLDEAEGRIKMLVESTGGPKLDDFDAEAAEEEEEAEAEDESPPPSRRRRSRPPRGAGLF
ncbi:MAG: exodeoxyribonuclease VII small subunit [Planctomycetota bacterium]|jgi:exodeoxyribonuclease VII small subunit